jgi:putative MATE family efflux protein
MNEHAILPHGGDTPVGGPWRIHHAREIVVLASPIVMSMISHTLMWTVDTIYLGRFSTLALGAAGLGGVLTWAAYSLFNNLSRINGTFVAQAHGRGDDEAVGHYTWQALYLSVATGLLLTLLGHFSHPLLRLTGNPADVVDTTYVYVRWRTVSAVFTQVGFTLLGYFQGRRDVRTPMWIAIAANALNAVLGLWLIFGWEGVAIGDRRLLAMPALGVAGAGIAMSISVAVNTLLMAAVILADGAQRRRYRIHVPRRLDLGALRNMIRVGLPSALEGFIDMCSFSMFTVLVGRAGAVQLAASQITVQLLSFSFMPMWGLTSAGAVLVGNWVGAGRPDVAARYGRQVYKMGVLYCLILAVIFFAFRSGVFRIFTPDPAILAFGAGLALVASVFQIGDGMRMVGSGLLTGAGDTRSVLLVTLAVMWGIFLPLTWLLVVRGGGDVRTAWLGGAACYALQAALLYARFRRGSWQRLDIFRTGAAGAD